MIRSPLRRALSLIGLAVSTTACLPQAVTAQGQDVAWLYYLFMLVAAGVFVLVAGLLAWSIVRYRGAPGRDVAMPPQSHGNMALEIAWWSLPTAIVIVLALFTIGVLSQVDARAEEPEVVVEVQGFQWGCEFTYPHAGVVVRGTAADPPTIRLPVGRDVAFVITSDDVVHSFNVPQFLIKRDAVPNRPNRFDVLIEEEGTYTGQCGEFCGLLHARQLFAIDAVQPEAFEAWLQQQAAEQDR